MFSRSIVAFAAACLCCQPAAALYVDKLQNHDILNTGSLQIHISGACQAELTLNDVSLHTYNPLDPFTEGLWLTGQTLAGDSVANYYNMVLIDAQLNVIAAYAPARTAQGVVVDNGLHLESFTETSSSDTFKSQFTVHAAQDGAGALDALLDYLSQYQPQQLHCEPATEDSYLTSIDESQSSVVVSDTTLDTPKQLRTKTTLQAKSVAALTSEQLDNHNDGSYRLLREQQPLLISIQFHAQDSQRY